MATHAYRNNPDSPIGKALDVRHRDTLVFKGEHEDGHRRQDSGGTLQGTRKQCRRNQDWRMDCEQRGERRQNDSTAVNNDIKRKSRIFHSLEAVFKIEQGGGWCSVSTGSDDRARDGKERAGLGCWQGMLHTGQRGEQRGDGMYYG